MMLISKKDVTKINKTRNLNLNKIKDSDFYQAIKMGIYPCKDFTYYLTRDILDYRYEKDPVKKQKLKKELPVFFPFGKFFDNERKDEKLYKITNDLILDFDAKDNPGFTAKQIRNTLMKVDISRSSYVSSSANGAHLHIKYRLDPKYKHKRNIPIILTQAINYIFEHTGLKADRKCINPSRSFFFSYDPGIKVNKKSKIFVPDISELIEKGAPTPKDYKEKYQKDNSNSFFSFNINNIYNNNSSSLDIRSIISPSKSDILYLGGRVLSIDADYITRSKSDVYKDFIQLDDDSFLKKYSGKYELILRSKLSPKEQEQLNNNNLRRIFFDSALEFSPPTTYKKGKDRITNRVKEGNRQSTHFHWITLLRAINPDATFEELLYNAAHNQFYYVENWDTFKLEIIPIILRVMKLSKDKIYKIIPTFYKPPRGSMYNKNYTGKRGKTAAADAHICKSNRIYAAMVKIFPDGVYTEERKKKLDKELIYNRIKPIKKETVLKRLNKMGFNQKTLKTLSKINKIKEYTYGLKTIKTIAKELNIKDKTVKRYIFLYFKKEGNNLIEKKPINIIPLYPTPESVFEIRNGIAA